MIAAIVLAAGQSRRFGGNKLLHRLPDGAPLILRATQTLTSVVKDVTVVVRPDETEIARCLRDLPARIVVCDRADEGMGASLACGVRARAKAEAWLVALGDMPFLGRETVQRVAARLAAGVTLVAASYNGQRGHPVGFGREFGPALMHLTGDTGARELLKQHAHRLELIESDDPGIVRDIDYPADLAPPKGRAPCG